MPTEFSLTAAWAAVESSPQWAAWTLQAGESWIMAGSISRSDVGLLPIAEASATASFRAIAGDGNQRTFIAQTHLPIGSPNWLPWITTFTSDVDDPDARLYGGQTPATFVDVASLASWLDAGRASIDDLRSILFLVYPQARVPVAHLQSVVILLTNDGERQTVLIGGGASGHLREVRV